MMSNNDVILWQENIETNLESMYSNEVWDLVETIEG